VFNFLKEPLIRKFGDDWFTELEAVYEVYAKKSKGK
jgi:hypothetical protein